MASNAISAQGVKLLVGTTLSSSTNISYTEIAELLDVSGPGETNNFTEITSHGSSAVERIANLNDPGELTFSINYLPDSSGHGSGSSGLKGLMRNQTKRGWRVTWPTSGTDIDEFDAFVANFEPGAPVNDRLTADVTLQISGSITSTTSS